MFYFNPFPPRFVGHTSINSSCTYWLLYRTELLHDKTRWSRAIIINLWPYTLRIANNIFNETVPLSGLLLAEHEKSPLRIFSGINVSANLNNMHTFDSPLYALNNTLQSGKSSIQKWDPRARLRINLGPSLHHTRSVILVLNLTTGIVFP